MTGTTDISESLAEATALVEIRALHPRVHCIVNEAAVSVTANVLLASGATPSMSHDPQEITAFTSSSNALSVNLGMLTQSKCQAITTAVSTASKHRIPWVLDPALSDRSEFRLEYCEKLLEQQPSVLRGNAAEIDAICRSMNLTREELARNRSIVVMTTGEVDQVVSQNRTQDIACGHPWMECITGLGCAFSALLAAFLTVIDDAFDAAVDIARTYGSIGHAAAARSHGPGTFFGHFLDCLYAESIQ